jgi:hypothetical protein
MKLSKDVIVAAMAGYTGARFLISISLAVLEDYLKTTAPEELTRRFGTFGAEIIASYTAENVKKN